MKLKLDEAILKKHYEEAEQQLEEFSKFNLSEKVEKIYSWLESNETVDASTGPEGARLFLKGSIESFIKNPDISQKIKNDGLYILMESFLDLDGGISYHEMISYMQYRLGLSDPIPQKDIEEIYEENALELCAYYP